MEMVVKRTESEFGDDKWPMAVHHVVEAFENVTETTHGLP